MSSVKICFAALWPRKANSFIHKLFEDYGMDECFAISLDRKESKTDRRELMDTKNKRMFINQDCIPLCDQTSKNLNICKGYFDFNLALRAPTHRVVRLELTTFKHKIILNDSSSVCLRSRNARSSFSASADYVAEASNVFVSSDGNISHQMGASVMGEALNDSDFDIIETKPVLMSNEDRIV